MALPVPEDESSESESEESDYHSLLSLLRNKVPAMAVEEAFDVFSAVAPEGWRVELIEGEIHVAPPAKGEHEEAVSELTGQMAQWRKDQRLRMYTGIGLVLPGTSVSGRAEPDVVIAPKGSFANQREYQEPAAVLLVAEVTSPSTADNDRTKKLREYARAGIPCYLLIDREAGTATLCTEPAGEDYASKVPYKLSETIPLPEPLGFDLDTSEF